MRAVFVISTGAMDFANTVIGMASFVMLPTFPNLCSHWPRSSSEYGRRLGTRSLNHRCGHSGSSNYIARSHFPDDGTSSKRSYGFPSCPAQLVRT